MSGSRPPRSALAKARYAFVYDDLRRPHRAGLIACVHRASAWRRQDVELADRWVDQQVGRRFPTAEHGKHGFMLKGNTSYLRM
jgi:hypothetical protein